MLLKLTKFAVLAIVLYVGIQLLIAIETKRGQSFDRIQKIEDDKRFPNRFDNPLRNKKP